MTESDKCRCSCHHREPFNHWLFGEMVECNCDFPNSESKKMQTN